MCSSHWVTPPWLFGWQPAMCSSHWVTPPWLFGWQPTMCSLHWMTPPWLFGWQPTMCSLHWMTPPWLFGWWPTMCSSHWATPPGLFGWQPHDMHMRRPVRMDQCSPHSQAYHLTPRYWGCNGLLGLMSCLMQHHGFHPPLRRIFPVEGIFLLELTWVLTPFSKNSFR